MSILTNSLEHISHLISPSVQCADQLPAKVKKLYVDTLDLSKVDPFLYSVPSEASLLPEYSFEKLQSLSTNEKPDEVHSDWDFPTPIPSNDHLTLGQFLGYADQIKDSSTNDKLGFLKNFKKLKFEDLYNKKNLLQTTLFLHQYDENDLVIPFSISYERYGVSTYHYLKTLGLGECACTHGKRFYNKRDAESNERGRVAFEQRLLFKINNGFNESKNNKITYLVVGSGACLSEWKIFSQLILFGYTNFDIHLVDFEYTKSEISPYPCRLAKFMEEFPDIQANVHIHTSLEEYAKENAIFDVAFAFDLEIPFKPLPTIELSMSENGISYCSRETPNWKFIKK